MGLFLPKSALPGLKQYKYGGVDQSLVSRYILKPFYQRFVLLFPLWLAPNLITLLGFAFVVVNTLTILYYNPTFDQECPSWVYASCAIGLFLYQTFDACDGAQARRTKQSGPLGELFDHCVDACNTTLEVVVFAAVTNMRYSWLVVIAQFATALNFYLSTWEEYHTGVLFLSVFSGPVEGILIVIGVYVITTFTGPWFWHSQFFDLLGISHLVEPYVPTSVLEATLNDAYIVFAGVGLAFNIVHATANVHRACVKKGKPVLPALTQTIPFFGFFASLFVWIYMSPDVLHGHLVPLLLASGAIIAYSVGTIITAHVTKQQFPVWNVLQLLPAIGIAGHVIGQMRGWDVDRLSLAAVFACLGLSWGIYGCFVGDIITEITTYLDIGCLYIKYPADLSDKDK
uniref:diacylglycerol cholinephosphotransferase n=1 Tax=Blastobotrys adeninivorans TaxID=409370 RepID=A0A060TDN5_BLAAD